MRVRLLFVILLALLIPLASVAKDAFPKACVDCHVKSGSADMRLSTLAKAWAAKAPATLIAKVSTVMPQGASPKWRAPIRTSRWFAHWRCRTPPAQARMRVTS